MGTRTDIVARVRAVVARLRWRVRLQTALRRSLLAGALGLVVFAAVIAGTRLRMLAPDAPLYAGFGAAALTVAAALSGLARRFQDIALAAHLDASAALHSRLSSALDFAHLTTPTELQRLAMEDALAVLDQAEPRRAAPWLLAPLALGLAALVGASLLNLPALWLLDARVPPGEAPAMARLVLPPPPSRPVVTLAPEDQRALSELAEALAEPTHDPAAAKSDQALSDLNALIRALQEGRISPEDAHAKLAELERALRAQSQDAAAEEAAEARLAEAARTVKAADPTLAEALSEAQRRDLQAAAHQLETLRVKLARGELDTKAQTRLARDLEQLAEALRSERQAQRDRLERERDRLKPKAERDRLKPRERDRLKEVERQLASFDQDHPADQTERQLEQLSDDLGGAAAELMRRLADKLGPLDASDGPEDLARRDRPAPHAERPDGPKDSPDTSPDLTEDELERAAQALKRMAQRQAGRQSARAASGKVGDLKAMLRRAAQRGQGDVARQGFERSARGQGDSDDTRPGQGGSGEDESLGDGKTQAGKKPGQGRGDLALLGGSSARLGGRPSHTTGAGQGAPSDGALGEGVGQGHDSRLTGAKTDLDVSTREGFVPGQLGEGPSTSRVIMAAAGAGFAARAYRDVHQDYAGVVEDTLEKEHIPPGKRTYVRRYFDLIRPR